ncbi:MAG: TIGR02391 family protein [Deltaproteobacteria bacterium]|nr:TIGR02391 family protein [Deltaproteobacteria bacterium]
MARHKIVEPVIEPKTFLSVGEIETGIAKLKRRIEEVQELNSQQIRFDDQKINNVKSNVRETIREVFGQNSPEFHEHRYHNIWSGGHAVGMSDHEYQHNFSAGIPKTVSMLEGLIQRLEEKKLDLPNASQLIQSYDFWNLVHPRIIGISRSRFESGHYADSVEAAFKEINDCVKKIVKKRIGDDLDGSTLMNRAFSVNNPVISLDDLSTENGKNIQVGFMQIFSGSMTGIRNPKAHSNISIDDKRAKHFIVLASLLMHKLDDALGI